MPRCRLLLVGLLLLWTVSAPAFAENRVALIIGNSNYKNVTTLPNPINDATAITQLFKAAGFANVELHQDLENNGLRHALRNFSDAAREAEIAIVFYAGHGIEVNGENYLIPIDAKLERDIDVEDEAVSLDRVLTMIAPARRLRLVILDACRDNPFLKTMKRTRADRAIGRGLARVEPTTPDTLIAFAAKAGSTAIDGEGANSPFTSALLAHLAAPGLDVRLALGLVRDEVLAKTRRKQEPFVYGSLGGEAIALVEPPAPPKQGGSAAALGEGSSAEVRSDYALAEKIGTLEAWESFLAQYNAGFYANLARAARAKLLTAEPPGKAGEASSRQREEERGTKAKATDPGPSAEPELAQTAKPVQSPVMEPNAAAPSPQGNAQGAVVAPAPAVLAPTIKQSNLATPEGSPEGAPRPERTSPASPSSGATARQLQAQLARVGCDPGRMDGQWHRGSRRALEAFNKHAGTNLDTHTASLDALDLVKTKSSRVCPVICEHGSRAHGDHCVELEKPGPRPIVRHAHREPVGRSRPVPAAASPAREHTGETTKTCNFIHGAMFCY
jgi:Caspase domain